MLFNKGKFLKQVILAILIAVAVGGVTFLLWSKQVAEVESDAKQAVEGQYHVTDDEVYIFGDVKTAKVGVILYPGAKIDPLAYATTANLIAQKGYAVFVPKMALNMAILSSDKANEIIEKYADIENWVIGGHSLGGVAAAQYMGMYPDAAQGLFFLGSYPTESTDFSQSQLPMLSIYGEKDGLTKIKDIEDNQKYFSKRAVLHEIKGGNHSQFGSYGLQSKDNEATISRKSQQEEVAETLDAWVRSDVFK